jgi:hypothetical protein
MAREPSTPMAMAVDIDEIVASPWVGLHYHRHELLDFDQSLSSGHRGSISLSDAVEP